MGEGDIPGCGSPAGPAPQRLEYKIVKDALDRLEWTGLETHLEQIGLDWQCFVDLTGHVRRSESLIVKYPNADRDQKKAHFIEKLEQYVVTALGDSAASHLERELRMLSLVERGYRAILSTLDECDISRLP